MQESGAQEPEGGESTASPSKALLASFSVERVAGDSSSRLALVTHGSSSCPWRAKNIQAMRDHTVTVTVESRPGTSERPCSLDDSTRRELLSLPDDVAATQITTVRLTAANGVSHTEAVATPD